MRMANWKKVKLEEVCSVEWGNSELTKASYIPDGEYLAVSAAGCDGRIGHREHAKNTPVISAIGANCGRMFLPREDFTAIKNTITITPVDEVSDGRYLYEELTFTELPKRGGAQPFMSKGDIESFKIPLPPLAEQRKIAEILRTWDEAIETAEAELKAKQSLLKRAVDKYFERTYRDAASGTVGELKTLDAVCTRKGEYGAAVSACPFNPEWPRYIRITDITDTGILKKERAVSISPESAEGYRLEIGDLLFARTGEPGRCLIFNEVYPAAFAGYLIRFKARPEVILSDYVYYYTLSSVYGKWVGDVSQKGAQANINAKVYGSLQLPVTDLASQGAAVRAFKALQEDVLLAERGVELLSAQKRGLMQKLLTGEVRVAA